jgi:hypothetical protein
MCRQQSLSSHFFNHNLLNLLYQVRGSLQIDPQELKDEGITEEEYIQDVLDDEFISKAEKLLQKEWEAGRFEDAVEHDQELENLVGEIL